MSLTFKEKELVAVGASVAAGCIPCTNYHFKKVREAGASDEDIKQAISEVLSIRDSATKIMEDHGLNLLEFAGDNEGSAVSSTRIKELICIAAAFSVNCTSNLEKHLAAARTAGITDDEIKWVLKTALFIKGKAASHVVQIAERIGNGIFAEETSEDTGGCGCGESEKTDTGSVVNATKKTEESRSCC